MKPIDARHGTAPAALPKHRPTEDPMRRALLALPLLLPALAASPARAGTPAEAEARQLYARFVAAQNAHDFDAVRATLLDSPRFLWVTNGLSLWGPEAAIARLRGFHGNEVWHIDPAWDRARTAEAGADTVLLHVPLVLTVGPRAGPARYRILITALCLRTTDAGWRIAALLTTDENPDGAG